MPTIAVSGLGCDGCEEIVETAVNEVRGVESVSADHEAGVVEYDGEADRAAITEAVEFAGYTIEDEQA